MLIEPARKLQTALNGRVALVVARAIDGAIETKAGELLVCEAPLVQGSLLVLPRAMCWLYGHTPLLMLVSSLMPLA